MTTRFCASCMADVGLDPTHSRLALPGCAQSRLAFCAGLKHDCTVLVNERGEVVPQRLTPAAGDESRLKSACIAKGSLSPTSLPVQDACADRLTVSSLVARSLPSQLTVGSDSRT